MRRSCTRRFLGADLTVALVGILLTPVADSQERIAGGGPTLPSIWTAGAVLAFAIKGGWRWAAVASTAVAAVNLIERGHPARDTVHNVILVWVASIAIGYVVEVARASERTLARALEIEAATRERGGWPGHPRQRAAGAGDGEAQRRGARRRGGGLGRLAGEQEVALRTLVSGGLVPVSRVSEDASAGAVVRAVEGTGRGRPGRPGRPAHPAGRLRVRAGQPRRARCPGAAAAGRGPRGGRRGRGGPGQRAPARRGGGAGLDPGGGRGRTRSSSPSGTTARASPGPAGAGRGRGPDGGGPVDPGPAARPRRQRRDPCPSPGGARKSN